MKEQFFEPDPGIALFLFAMAITVIGSGIMDAFGYAKIAHILRMCTVGIVLIAFFINTIISIYERLRDKSSDEQNEEKK